VREPLEAPRVVHAATSRLGASSHRNPNPIREATSMSIKEAATTPQSVAGDQLVRAHPDAGSSVAILQRSRRTPLGLLADVLSPWVQ